MATYTIGPDSLRAIAPGVGHQSHARARELGTAMHRLGIVEPEACAHFVAQCAHESGEFRFVRELWGPTIAQRGYWRRRNIQGAGPLYPGLGFLTRGAGYIQTTGRVNFKAAAKRLGVTFTHLLAVCGSRKYAALMAAVWWAAHLPRNMRGWTCERVTRVVNGGTNGLAEREHYTRLAMAHKQFLVPRKA
jgi:putative chitinase